MTNKEALKQLCDSCVYNKYIVNYIPGLKQCKAMTKGCHCKAYLKIEKLITKKRKKNE